MIRAPLSFEEINRRREERSRLEAEQFLEEFKHETIIRESTRQTERVAEEQRESEESHKRDVEAAAQLEAKLKAWQQEKAAAAQQPKPSAPPLLSGTKTTVNGDPVEEPSTYFPAHSTSSSSSPKEVPTFTSKLPFIVVALLGVCLRIGEFIFHYTRPAWNKPAYEYDFQLAAVKRKIPLWAAAIKEFYLSHQESILLAGFIFAGFLVFFTAIQFIAIFGAPLFDRRDLTAFSVIGRKLTPLESLDQAQRFFNNYLYYDTDIRIIMPSIMATNTLLSDKPAPGRDMDGNGRDDDIDNVIEHQYASSESWVDALPATIDSPLIPSSTSSAIRVILPRVAPINDALCGSLFPQYDARYDKIMQRRGCWDVYKFNLDDKYNNKAYAHRRAQVKYGALSNEYKKIYVNTMRSRNEAENSVRNDAMATVLSITNLEVGMATPFIYLGYLGLDTTLMIHPELLALQPGDDEEARLRNYMEPREANRSPKQLPGIEQAAKYVFQVSKTQRETPQPRGVRISYYTLPSDEELNRYYTTRFGDTYTVWMEADKERMSIERKTSSADHWFVRFMRWVVEAWRGPRNSEAFEGIHEHVLEYRTEVFRNRYAQMVAYMNGTTFAGVSPKLRTLNVTLDEPTRTNRFDRPPTLVKVERFFPYPFSKYIIEALTEISAWAHRRQDVHDYRTGHRTVGLPAEDELRVLQYFSGVQKEQEKPQQGGGNWFLGR